MPAFTLVTEALSPLGRREAASLAARGKDLVLLGEERASLEDLASELRVLHDRDVRTFAVDLGEPGATEQVLGWLRDRGLLLDGAVCVRCWDPRDLRAEPLERGLAALEEALSQTLRAQGGGFVSRVRGSSLPRQSSAVPLVSERKRKETDRGHADPTSR